MISKIFGRNTKEDEEWIIWEYSMNSQQRKEFFFAYSIRCRLFLMIYWHFIQIKLNHLFVWHLSHLLLFRYVSLLSNLTMKILSLSLPLSFFVASQWNCHVLEITFLLFFFVLFKYIYIYIYICVSVKFILFWLDFVD